MGKNFFSKKKKNRKKDKKNEVEMTSRRYGKMTTSNKPKNDTVEFSIK